MKARPGGFRRRWGWPLVPLYAAALAVRDWLRSAGFLRTRRLGWPVVSVGSLSAGGAGKTPVVIALGELLGGRGWYVDVLSRGYGRAGRGVDLVDAGAGDAAARFGDEPVVIAQRAGVAVWVGGERFAAGVAAEVAAEGGRLLSQTIPHPSADSAEEWGTRVSGGVDGGVRGGGGGQPGGGGARVHLLDDGFQHRRLARALDIVLVTEEDLDDALLPAGNLREPLTALGRADVVVLREEEWERVRPRVGRLLREGAMVWRVRRELRFPDGMASMLAEQRPVAFCAIARPEGFWAMLASAGCEVVETVVFADHHRYVPADVERLVSVASGRKATRFLTTEKDAVKLTQAMVERLESVGPVGVVSLDLRFVDETEVLRELEGRLR